MRDVKGVKQAEVYFANSAFQNATVSDGGIFQTLNTTKITGGGVDFYLAGKSTLALSLLDMPSTVSINNPTLSANLETLLVYGNELPGAGIGGGDATSDTFQVQAVSVPTSLFGQGGDDVFNLSSDAGTNAGNLLGIKSNVTIDAGTGNANRLTISDFGNGANPDARLDVVSGLQRLRNFAGPSNNVDIFYTATGGAFANTTAANTPKAIAALSADPKILVTSAAHGLSTGDRVLISGVVGQTRVNGIWTVTFVNANQFQIDVSGSGANAASYTANSGQWVRVQDGVVIRGSNSSSDSITIRSTLANANLVLQGNGGDDVFNVGGLPDPVKDAPVVAGVNDGQLNLLQGPLFIDTGAGTSDRVNVNDHGSGTAMFNYLLTPTSLQSNDPARTFGGLVYAGAEFLRLDGTDEANVFDVKPSVTTELFINGNLPVSGTCGLAAGDYLRLDTTEPDIIMDRKLKITAVGEGSWTFNGKRKDVKFASIERFNHVDIVATAPAPGAPGGINVYDAETGEFKFTIPNPYEALFKGGINVVTGDVNCDGLPDVLTVPASARKATLKAFNGAPDANGNFSKTLIFSFDVFPATFVGGATLALGDINKDNINDVVVGANAGWMPLVAIYNGSTLRTTPALLRPAFYAFPTTFRGGVGVAVGDFNGDGYADIAAASGPGMPATVGLFSGLQITTNTTPTAVRSIVPYGNTMTYGLNIAIGDLNGDKTRDLIIGARAGWLPYVTVYSGVNLFTAVAPTKLANFLAFDAAYRGGVNVASKALDGGGAGATGQADKVAIWFAPQTAPGTRKVRAATFTGINLSPQLVDKVFEAAFLQGVNIG